MGRLTTHVLDTMNGCPAAGMAVSLYRMDGAAPQLLQQLQLNHDGRADQPLLADAALLPGRYRLVFAVLPYFRGRGVVLPEPAFLDEVPLDFGIADASLHYHVPLAGVARGAIPPTAAADQALWHGHCVNACHLPPLESFMRLNIPLRKALAAATLLAVAAPAALAAYPDKPIRIVVTFAAGGASDIVARVISEPLGKALGTTVIVDNKPGAGGTLGGMDVVRAPADGYTLMLSNSTPLSIGPFTVPKQPYDPIKQFTPRGAAGRGAGADHGQPQDRPGHAEGPAQGHRGRPGLQLRQRRARLHRPHRRRDEPRAR